MQTSTRACPPPRHNGAVSLRCGTRAATTRRTRAGSTGAHQVYGWCTARIWRQPGRSAVGEANRGRPASFREVFAVSEFRALWFAEVQSVLGDQLARVAI